MPTRPARASASAPARPRYRVFVSYARADEKYARTIVNCLDQNGLVVLWDRRFAASYDFPGQIEDYIAHAHVFVPFMSASSMLRPWVNEEIGLAYAMRVPVLPITRGVAPGALIARQNAIEWTESPGHLRRLLAYRVFAGLVESQCHGVQPPWVCAGSLDQRTDVLCKYARRVVELGHHGYLRQKGGFSTFNIPDKPLNNPVWAVRRRPFDPRPARDRLLLEERRILREHAARCGCCLMVNPTAEHYQTLAPEALYARLEALLRFIQSMPLPKLRIVVNRRLKPRENTTIVGDWFCAEAGAFEPDEGLVDTIFTRHAPTVMAKAAEFDREFQDVVEEQGGPGPAREQAIRMIKHEMRKQKQAFREGA